MGSRTGDAVTAYTDAVEACMAEVGQQAPEWSNGNCAFWPGDGVGPSEWWHWLDKAIDMCEELWSEDDWST